MNRETAKTVLYYVTKLERIICLKIKAKHHNIVIIQVYAPNEIAEEAEKTQFYEELRETIKEHKKSRDQLIVMGDFNAKVGEKRENKVVGPYGMGERNDNGELLIGFCKEEDLVLANTWFERRYKNRHTWESPDGKSKNQIDFILVSQRYRNSVKNAKVRPSADCGSDHHLVMAKIEIRLKKIRKSKRMPKWNREVLLSPGE